MPSPFPGMDPYLEGPLWPDLHHRLADMISRILTVRFRPRYVARIEVRVIKTEVHSGDISIMYPDVGVLQASRGHPIREAALQTAPEWVTAATPAWEGIPEAPLKLPLPLVIEFRQATIEVRDTANNELITVIELISPANKREPGLSQYIDKRQKLIRSGIHLLEIDLIRRGVRPVAHPKLPQTAYLVALTRGRAGKMELWPLNLPDPLPMLPVPLRAPDPDAPLDLAAAVKTIYDEAAYDLSIDYSQTPPPPPVSEEELQLIRPAVSSPDHGSGLSIETDQKAQTP